MKAFQFAQMFCVALFAAPFVTGCDKTVEEKTTVTKTANGGETKDTTKVTVSSDGKTVTKTEEHKVVPPADSTETKTKDSTKVTVSSDGKTVTKTEEHTNP